MSDEADLVELIGEGEYEAEELETRDENLRTCEAFCSKHGAPFFDQQDTIMTVLQRNLVWYPARYSRLASLSGLRFASVEQLKQLLAASPSHDAGNVVAQFTALRSVEPRLDLDQTLFTILVLNSKSRFYCQKLDLKPKPRVDNAWLSGLQDLQAAYKLNFDVVGAAYDFFTGDHQHMDYLSESHTSLADLLVSDRPSLLLRLSLGIMIFHHLKEMLPFADYERDLLRYNVGH